MSTLRSAPVRAVLDRIAAAEAASREAADARFTARRAEVAGARLSAREVAAIYRDAPLAVTTQVAELLYVLARGRPAPRIVEFGMSFARSTIHLAAAVRDGGAGSVVTSELDADKAEVGRRNLTDAGLADLVEVRVGDAMETLRALDAPIDLLFLDGLNELYLPLLVTVEPRLAAGALVVADRSEGDPAWPRYREHVRDPASGYVSVEAAGVELSVRALS